MGWDVTIRPKETSDYRAESVDRVLRSLQTGVDGLNEAEAQSRLKKFGYNELPEKKGNPAKEFLLRLWGPMPWLLELAAALAYVLGHATEAGIIVILLLINSVIGFRHSQSSKRALEFLKLKLAIRAKLLRDGRWTTKEAREMVPGDIFVVGLGDIVPADAMVLDGELSVDQSALTGESMPVRVTLQGLVYSGSVVIRGEAKCVTLNTGANTFFGKTAELMRSSKPKSHQEDVMFGIIKYMMYLSMIALAFVTAYAFYMNKDYASILTFAVIFLMAAIPVALPAVLTVVQAVGAMQLAKRGALVTRLDSVEDAASMDVLCLDKTGTITQNRLSVTGVVPFFGHSEEEVVQIAALASKSESKDLIDLAVIDHATSLRISLGGFEQVAFTPFDPSTKVAEAMVKCGDDSFRAVKGSPQTVLAMCVGLSGDETKKVADTLEGLSRKGYRSLGVARSTSYSDPNDLRLLGIVSLADPIRPDSKEMIEGAKELGIKPIMLTGDNVSIAKEVARQVSIGDRIVTVEELKKLDEQERPKLVEECNGFAQIYPEDKHTIVKLLQSNGHIVGMTGDGVNDAPALKQAEVGIAVSTATDVAKSSASMVLTEQGVGVIVDAVKLSRQTYQRMLSWVINKVTKTIQVIGLLTIGFFWTHEVLLSLLGMTLLVFANDFATMSLSTDNVKHSISPNVWNVRRITFASLVIGLLLVLESALGVYVGVAYFHLDLPQLQTLVLVLLVFTSQMRVLIVRERKHFWSSVPGRELLVSSIATTAAFVALGTFGLIIPPIPFYQVLLMLGFALVFTALLDIPKYFAFRKFGL